MRSSLPVTDNDAALLERDVHETQLPCMVVNVVLVGAEAVTANGGIISRMGTYQLALIAKARRKDFFVAAEQHKFGKTFPVDQYDLGSVKGLRTGAAPAAESLIMGVQNRLKAPVISGWGCVRCCVGRRDARHADLGGAARSPAA